MKPEVSHTGRGKTKVWMRTKGNQAAAERAPSVPRWGVPVLSPDGCTVPEPSSEAGQASLWGYLLPKS